MAGRFRLWAERASPGALGAPEVLEPLRARGVRLMVAVTPDTHAALRPILVGAADEGVEVTLWPLLDEADGLWLHASTVPAFARFVDELLPAYAGVAVEVAFDLEPPPSEVRALVRGRLPLSALRRRIDSATRAAVVDMVQRVQGHGLSTLGVVAPPILFDGPGAQWEHLLGTPVSGVPFDAVHVMLYTSLFEGYLGPIGRADARALLHTMASRARARFGERAGVSLGLTGGGALGDERPLAHPEELAEDVASVRHAGIEDIAIHGLAGMLARPPMEAWLDTLDTPPAPSPRSVTASLLMALLGRIP